jgi:superfamily I DNA and/or RNA helicase
MLSIKASIQRIEAKLESGSFEYAKAFWIERLRADDESIRAIDALDKLLQQNRGQIVPKDYETFKAALRTVPIWVTTAQAANAIPLEPELFDTVVIDEASQCTLTNLLPLIYRGRTLAVIGDDKQLPAIPTIQEAEELSIARKHNVEDYLSLLGHSSNNVYKTSAESLPRRRADIITLIEHFRSHPQIIGFSNRHIYLQRLELKKDPNWGKRLPVGSGVHVQAVSGFAQRGKNGRSWVNIPEAEKVVSIVQQLRAGDSRSLGLGVVTPFVAQKEAIREKLDRLELSADVLVDTAYGFQGDERDVIIFSPTVSRGITPHATLWVETPPNLINVAITRAREAFYFVGDIDLCLQQRGMLRHLALYCRQVQTLRETSPAELELFSWMMVKGWNPKVHPMIGDIEVDFSLSSQDGTRLAIEVDGHRYHGETVNIDRGRDAFLIAQGYEVFRTSARDVLETPYEVVHQIEQKLSA